MQIPVAPPGMVMSPHYNLILGANVLILAAFLVWIVREARQTKSLVPVLMMIGAGVASLGPAKMARMIAMQSIH